MNVWIQFMISAALVIIAGIKLTQYADVIAKKSRLGTVWVGSILLALGTSLPELVAGVSSGLLGFPDLAVGNVLGSNIFNVAIIALVDLLDGKRSILRKVSLGHILSANFGMLLSTVVAIALFMDLPYRIGWLGLDTLIIAAVYLFGLRMISRYEARDPQDHPVILADGVFVSKGEYDSSLDLSLARASAGFAVSALIIAVAGTYLSISSEEIAIITGLGSTFVGSTLLAIATSLPEVVASITAVRAGAFDLAVGNLFGSNIFNMVILLASDVAYTSGPILAAVSDTHILTALFGLVLSTIAVTGLFYRSSRNYFKLGPDTIFIFVVYILSAYALFVFR